MEYQYVKTLSDLKKAISTICKGIYESKLIAVGFEGDNISRTGSISVLTIATRTDVFIFDILELGSAAFDKGISFFLKNESITKIVFDCREPADSLLHVHGVLLTSAYDIQLLQCIDKIDGIRSRYGKLERRRRVDEVIEIKSLMATIQFYVGTNLKFRKMEDVSIQLKSMKNVWSMRPINEDTFSFLAYTMTSLYMIYCSHRTWTINMSRLKVASAIYCNTKRAMRERSFDPYEVNQFLPIDIIPDNGMLFFEKGNKPCTGCKRRFPINEFSKKDLRGCEQKCRVCKVVKISVAIDGNSMKQKKSTKRRHNRKGSRKGRSKRKRNLKYNFDLGENETSIHEEELKNREI